MRGYRCACLTRIINALEGTKLDKTIGGGISVHFDYVSDEVKYSIINIKENSSIKL